MSSPIHPIKSPDPRPIAVGRWAILLLLAFISGCSAKALGGTRVPAVGKQAALPSGELLYFRKAPRGPYDLWLQSLDGKTHRPLTSSGNVELLPTRGSLPGHWEGAAISPDRHWVAYVEFQVNDAPDSSMSHGPMAGWNTLFVVSTDGKSRRELVDLRRQPLPQGRVRAGSIIWSDDGRSILYALETPATKDDGSNCPQVTLQSVDVESGRVTSLSEARPLGYVTLLGWSTARGEVFLYGECSPPLDEAVGITNPLPGGHFTVLRPGDGTLRQQSALAPSLSPGGTFVFIPSQPRTNAPPAIYRTESLTLTRALSPELSAWYVARLVWLHHSPTALISAVPNPIPPECTGTRPQQQRLFRLEMDTGLFHQVREEASAMNIVAISPDDTYVLVGLPTKGFSPTLLCGEVPNEALYLVRRKDLESELSVDALRRRATLLTPSRMWSAVGAFAEYVGWVR
jgi:hypothetical protein